MTGYLQRLIAGATMPSRLHPFTAPLLAGIPQTPSLTLQETITVPKLSDPRPPHLETEAPPPSALPEIPRAASKIQAPPPAAPNLGQQPRLAAPALPQSAIPIPAPASAVHIEKITNISTTPNAPAKSAIPTLPQIVARLTDQPPRATPFVTPPPRRAQPDSRAPQPEAEPTQVNIHIGRVDVIAVPATPSRPATPTAGSRKPMSLDEYLRRQDGRF
jgi:hypothetical protein